ncbi:hypothetical protein ACXR6G_12680 [Ancylomarina sp. YFZ004]
MDKSKTSELKWHLEGFLLSRIEEAILDVKEIPEVMHRVIVNQIVEDYCQEIKNHYSILKKKFEDEKLSVCFTIPEFNQVIDEVESHILKLLTE